MVMLVWFLKALKVFDWIKFIQFKELFDIIPIFTHRLIQTLVRADKYGLS